MQVWMWSLVALAQDPEVPIEQPEPEPVEATPIEAAPLAIPAPEPVVEPEPAPEPEAPPVKPQWHQHSIAACVGNRCGGLGGLYVFRLNEAVSFAAGVGLYGVGAAGRYHPVEGTRSVYLSAGISPVFVGDDPVYGRYTFYGADLTVGGEWRARTFFISGGAGVGLAPLPLAGIQAGLAFDVAIGINLVRGKAAEQ
jgi:hypothetical protein